jgi:uncharacterized cupin superfamily protein
MSDISDMKILKRKLTEEPIRQMGIRQWPIWTKEISEFEWFYDSREQCLFLEGEVTVETKEGLVKIVAGDFVTFPQGLSCKWRVEQPVKKHYRFD